MAEIKTRPKMKDRGWARSVDYRQIRKKVKEIKDIDKIMRDIPRKFFEGLYVSVYIKELELGSKDARIRRNAAEWFVEQLKSKSFVETMNQLTRKRAAGRPPKDDGQKVQWNPPKSKVGPS